jgi:glycosyltransferase involved in cell wall biosynthesis
MTSVAESSPPPVDFILPVYNEGANIGRALYEIDRLVALPKRVLVVYDFDGDDTVPVVRALHAQRKFPWAVLHRNDVGRGVANAVKAGIAVTESDVVIVTMADLSDDLTVVPAMVDLIRNQRYDIVCASRYMRGGKQIGGPWLKGLMSRTAGVSLYWMGALPTHDATNAFRAYRREVLLAHPIESTCGFAYSLEITAKAHTVGRRITEVPSVWRDRSAGQSRFKLRAWLPDYMKWYFYALTHRFKPAPASPR